jgi:hypothetical protein
VKVEDLDARLGRVEDTVILVAACHFALQATGTFIGVDRERLLHISSSQRGFTLGRVDRHPIRAPACGINNNSRRGDGTLAK